jgi:diguanylate cyclase
VTSKSLIPAMTCEADRLAELRSLELLDTQREDRFDAVTQLASRSLDMPVALVSLVDEQRQWLKSAVGVDFRETPRDVSFCTVAIQEPQILVVPDATQDPRFASSPLVTHDPRFRFYAGAVIRGPRGQALGTLCVLDYKARQMSEEDRSRLLYLARLVEWEIRQDQLIARMLLEVEKDKLTYTTSVIPDRRAIYEQLAAAMSQDCEVVIALGKLQDGSEATSTGTGKATLQWELTQRLRSLPPDIQVGLWRHNQFLAFRCSHQGSTEVAAFEKDLRDALEPAYDFGGMDIPIHTVVGIASFPADSDSVRTLLQCAQAAAVSKEGQAFCVGVYARDIAASARRSTEITQRLAEAVPQGYLRLEYQPIFDTADGSLREAEALLRWTDPHLGAVSPGEFIPIAERTDLVSAIGTFVLREAVGQLSTWCHQGLQPVPVSVNLSSRQLRAPGFADFVVALVKGAGIDPSLLKLEVTEHALVSDLHTAAATLQRLHDAGVECSVDDFGVGFSSLNYVRRLPISTLKIDREFIDGIERDQRSADIVAAIVGMARTLGIQTTAEGVELAEQMEVLRRIGCDRVQGFLTGRAEPVQRFSARLSRQDGSP